MLKKSDFFVSWIIFSIVFYIPFLLFSIILSKLIPVSAIFWFVLIIVVVNVSFIVSDRLSARKFGEDFRSPLDETESNLNTIIQFAYSLPPSFSKSFEFIYRIFQLSMSYGPFICAINIRKDWICICENADHFCPINQEHNAIMIGVYNQYATSALLGCGISHLINSFIENGEKYRVYFFRNRKEFFDVMNCPTATNIWIFAHGWRGGVRFPYGKCCYSDLIKRISSDAQNKEAIYQFHCNPGNDPSLVELLSVKRGFVNHRFNNPEGIKEYIRIIIEENRQKDLIILN